MLTSSKPTGAAPPGSFIHIHVININHSAMASNMRLFLESQIYAGRHAQIISTHTFPTLPTGQVKIKVAAVVFCFDEDTDIPGTLYLLDKTYDAKTAIIAHILYEDDKIRERISKSRIKQIAIGYDHTELIAMIQKIAFDLVVSEIGEKPTP